MIYIGADHRGYALKEALKAYLLLRGFQVEDCGAHELNIDDDYPDFASIVAEKVSENPAEHCGVSICGSGHGMDIVANKYKGVRAALCFNAGVAKQSREHEDANVLMLASDWLKERDAKEVLNIWLEAQFDGAERNVRRLRKIREVEEKNFK
ncbi:MAG: RpiB/LacA/LacB family sugar-phosphate isomerase [Candidatus Sungbacteria bacterium]|nr:RpiB/LacA/LacB family sugar-phosphate isomerase [Candidatus Sungbacteria bacterium]